jgi:ankyrin repeat protein
MLNKDALLTYKSKKKGNSPLHIAIQREYKQLLLVLAKTKIIQDSQNKSGDTPVHHAIKKGMLHYLPLLCIGNKSLNLKNNDGLTSLDILFHTLFKELPKSDEEQKKKIEIHHTLVSYVALLLENGADPNSYCDEKENNALYLAVETNNPKLVALLIQHGIDACKKNKNEETALHRAIRNMEINQDIVLSLFQNVELLEIRDKHGHTPYNLIQQNIHWVEIFDKARKQKNKTS